MTNSPIPINVDYYRGQTYWNDFEIVRDRINRRISGSSDVDWIGHLSRTRGSCDVGLFVHCGNGWVEREFHARGLLGQVIGTDVDTGLLSAAREAAQAAGISAQYLRRDSNLDVYSDLKFDWVINHAALHHVARIDHAVRAIALALPADGLLIGFDYTGPQRNQYGWQSWERMVEVWRDLPKGIRTDLRYPHLPTMLATDPSEAVQSHRILETVGRYFTFLERVPLGGAIAYQLLHGASRLYAARDEPEGLAALERILAADDAILADNSESSFFTFWVARPRPDAFDDRALLARWTAEEDEREARAAAAGGRYGPPAVLEIIYNEIADLRDQIAAGPALQPVSALPRTEILRPSLARRGVSFLRRLLRRA